MKVIRKKLKTKDGSTQYYYLIVGRDGKRKRTSKEIYLHNKKKKGGSNLINKYAIGKNNREIWGKMLLLLRKTSNNVAQ